jgi:ATP-binding cassette subfamily B protein
VGWVPQDALLGDGSVRDNLVFGLGPVDDGRINRMLIETGCVDFVGRLPQGLDTPLGHQGHRLSGGERQRLALARALLREPLLLVLDEPTSALDGESERTVLAALARTRTERTTLVIAHRLSTVADADCIVVMDAGRIVDQGRHAELLARCALYRRLCQPEEGHT